MRWELIDIGENPMKLVRVRGTSKRRREPIVLGVGQFRLLLDELQEPFRTMVVLDLATGLRCSELFALQWRDALWEQRTLLVRRAIVTGVVSDVKTKYSNAGIRCGIGRVGWHTFRHTFRTLLDETGAPMKVQQELMRHADIRTTMNVYGRAMDASKREAHGKVVRMVLAAKVA
ncbi:MAG TPA: site-specific integrase [Candidatus Acidoferrales bacterium]|nr:site-specific integrase [Candidatus Acidoferrales bacterium]